MLSTAMRVSWRRPLVLGILFQLAWLPPDASFYNASIHIKTACRCVSWSDKNWKKINAENVSWKLWASQLHVARKREHFPTISWTHNFCRALVTEKTWRTHSQCCLCSHFICMAASSSTLLGAVKQKLDFCETCCRNFKKYGKKKTKGWNNSCIVVCARGMSDMEWF